MRTVGEIVGAVQERQETTEEELRLALLCLYYHTQIHRTWDHEEATDLLLRMRAKQEWESRFRMMKSAPDTYLGSRWTPGTPENDQARRVSEAVAKKAGVL